MLVVDLCRYLKHHFRPLFENPRLIPLPPLLCPNLFTLPLPLLPPRLVPLPPPRLGLLLP